MCGDGEEVVTQCLTLVLGHFPTWLTSTLNAYRRKGSLSHLKLSNSNESAVAVIMLCKKRPHISVAYKKHSFFFLRDESVGLWGKLRLWTGFRSGPVVSHSKSHTAAWTLLYP